MITVSPMGLSTTALVANQVSLLVNIKEKLCRPYCINSSLQPQATVTYTYDTPVLNGTTVFVPIIAVVTIVTPGNKCSATTQLFTEKFYAAFQGQNALPSAVTIESLGHVSRGSNITCYKASQYEYTDSLTVALTTA